jgi:hypothetical protein
MTDNQKGVRVFKRGEDNVVEGGGETLPEDNFHCGVISTGKKVCLRDMIASDLLFMEKQKVGDTERSMKLAERLSSKTGYPITFSEIVSLRMKDLKIITKLVSDAADVDDEDEDEDFSPN